MDTQEIIKWLIPGILVLIGPLVGILFNKGILPLVSKLLGNHKAKYGDLVMKAIPHRTIIFWFFCAGVYLALLNLPLDLDKELVKVVAGLFKAATIVSITFIFVAIASSFVRLLTISTDGLRQTSSIFLSLTSLTIYIIGTLMLLNSFGISVTPILTALGVGGLAVALALQDTLSNFFSGLQIILSRQLRPGNYIKLSSGEEGYVEDINWRNTTVRDMPDNMVVIPNSKLSSTIVMNFHLPEKELSVLVQVGVSYDSDLQKVEKITVEVAKEIMKNVKGGVPSFEPFIRYHTFGDSSINFSVILRAQEFKEKHIIKHEFIKKLHERYKKENIEIPFPTRTVYNKNAAVK